VSTEKPVRIGIMGFGRTGRQIYELAARSSTIEIVVIADIGDPKILHYLLTSESEHPEQHRLEGNFLVNPRFRSRMVPIDRPAEVPWDVFNVDMVIDSTGKYQERRFMEDHLGNGAKRVLLRTLPVDHIDRIVIPGINHGDAQSDDQMISAASATTTALALLLKIVSDKFELVCASSTSIHAYTSDQALQDYAGSDYRRSRSAAKNIIPNGHEAARWMGRILPNMEDKVLSFALNVPIHEGCLLDTNLVFKDADVEAEQINQLMRTAVSQYPDIVDVAEDPIVSSDVIDCPFSLLFDTKGTIKAGSHIIKALAWYENMGHAARLLDVARLYAQLDRTGGSVQ